MAAHLLGALGRAGLGKAAAAAGGLAARKAGKALAAPAPAAARLAAAGASAAAGRVTQVRARAPPRSAQNPRDVGSPCLHPGLGPPVPPAPGGRV